MSPSPRSDFPESHVPRQIEENSNSQTKCVDLSEGVLDGSDESLKSAKLKSGTEATLARLNQMLGKITTAKSAPKSPPTDPALAFAEKANHTFPDR